MKEFREKLKKLELEQFFSIIMLLILTAGVVIVSWQTFYPYSPITIKELKVTDSVLYRGGWLRFTILGEKNMALPVEVNLELSNSFNIHLANYNSNSPAGQIIRYRQVSIPYHAPPGKYRLHWTGTYHINRFNTVVISKYSDEFEIK